MTKPDKRFIAAELVLLSGLALYLELLAIRWISADIRAFTVLRTLPLITCFIGLGVGFATGNERWFKLSPLFLVLFVAAMKFVDLFDIGFFAFPSSVVFQWQELAYSVPDSGWYLILFLVFIPLVLAGPFALMLALGSRLGALFREFAALPAYCLNVWGSLMGSLLFSLLSCFELNPYQLLLPAIFLLALYLPRSKPLTLVYSAVLLLLVLLVSLPSHHARPLAQAYRVLHDGESKTYWSPYQRIDLTLFKAPAPNGTAQPGLAATKFGGLELGVNRAFYQYFFSDAMLNGSPPAVQSALRARQMEYALPFQSSVGAQDVLVVGAGVGQNVSAALKQGASSVDAVEIDPVIIRLGHLYNPDYQRPQVHLICDDARHYFERCSKKYDVISFSLLDSQAVTGQGSSVRLDSYVYTRESFRKALSLLRPNGILVVSFALRPESLWIGERILHTLHEAAGYSPWTLYRKTPGERGDKIYLTGEGVKRGDLKLPEGWLASPDVSMYSRILTDDWPFLYVRDGVLDLPYLLVVAESLILSVAMGRHSLSGKAEVQDRQMFFLGAAFLLLELHAISSLSILYGSTWITSALVISGILLLILLANWLAMKTAVAKHQAGVYGLLFLSIIVSYCVHPGVTQFGLSGLLTVLTLLPLGLAALLFACVFKSVADSPRALAFNLFGALLGGLLEYLSNYTGIRGLELIALLLYLLSLPLSLRKAEPKAGV